MPAARIIRIMGKTLKFALIALMTIILGVSLIFASVLFGCTMYKPLFKPNVSSTWRQYATPEEAGWSAERLKTARAYYDQLGSTAFMVIYRGNVLAAWGDIEANTPCHSVRKSFISALYGVYTDRGKIGMDKTLRELNIDDTPPLTPEEREARVCDLLKARSGVYHFAAAEPQTMKNGRPERGSHAPGTFWYYNNWDFNALGTIFRQETKEDIFKAFATEIARPLGMEDFNAKNNKYLLERGNSIHPAYAFKMSARDMARFGQLYLQKGIWEGCRLISEKWVTESIVPYSRADNTGYGYLWWIDYGLLKKYGAFSALGMYGNRIDVLPSRDMVFVHRVNSTIPDKPFMKAVSDRECEMLISMIVEARTGEAKSNPRLMPLRVQR